MFPNPVTSVLNIKSEDVLEEVRIYDLNGNLILVQTTTSISEESLAVGTYLINIKTATGYAQNQFVRIGEYETIF